MKHVTYEKWQEFDEKFPDASAFLRHHDMVGELINLRSRNDFGLLNDWEKTRLTELEKLDHLVMEVDHGDHIERF